MQQHGQEDRGDGEPVTVSPREESAEERSPKPMRGRLTVFFGSAPGVGKTYAMLEAARFEREEGRDVVVGVVDSHGRYDTGALLLGLELLPRLKPEELDLDAALARRPELIIVDDLAHTNVLASGSRHTKRWQDVDELLDAGIDVYTTLNVENLESLVDIVNQITNVVVKETVPDSVLDNADEVRLIDLPIDELLERARSANGKKVTDEGVGEDGTPPAFLREGNLIALRELALRLTAQRVDAQMRRYREKHGIDRTWAVSERVLVCVSASPASERLIRGARRLAASLHADFIAVYVETPSALRLAAADRKRLTEHLRLAQSLGAETITLTGVRGPDEVIDFARSRNVSRIVVGKPTHSTWRDRLRPSFLDQLVRLSGDIEVDVLSGTALSNAPAPSSSPRRYGEKVRRPIEPMGFVASFVAVLVATAFGRIAFGNERAQLADVVMVMLLGIVLVSLRWGLYPSLLASVLSVMSLDFFFIPPFHTLAVTDVTHIATFAVMFIVAVVISGLTKRIRDQAEAAHEREIRTASLYSLSGTLSRSKTTHDVLLAGTKHVSDVFGVKTCVLVPAPNTGRLLTSGAKGNAGEADHAFEIDDKERSAADWTFEHGRPAGFGTDTLPKSRALYLPLEASSSRVGVLGVLPGPNTNLDHDRRQHLEAFARLIAGALDRTRLAERAQQAQLRVEAEQLRNSLLSSVSHDLRTPLAIITGTASTLLEEKIDPHLRKELTEGILDEAERLNRLVQNLLDMTRLEAGAIRVKKDWQSIEETIGVALERVSRALGDRSVTTDAPADLPLVKYDSILLQQVLVNLLENAAKYTPPKTKIAIVARVLPKADEIEVSVRDHGPGLPPGEETKIFEKFYRAEKGRGGGVGLGLTICKGIITAHGGRIWAETLQDEGGGAAFHFTLPLEDDPPALEMPDSVRKDGSSALETPSS